LPATVSKDLQHFCRMAQKGVNPAASTYERRAYQIALAISRAVCGFDGSALCGLAEFAEWGASDARALALWVESLDGPDSR
jgi:hypothetical protein